MANINEEIVKIINNFKENYYIKSVKDFNIKLSNDNESELSACMYLINKMVKDFEYYLEKGYNISNVKKEFYEDYKEIIKKFTELYCNSFIKDIFDNKFTSSQKKYVYDKIINKYNIEKESLININKIIEKEFSKFIPKKEKDKADIIDYKEYKKHKIIVTKDDYDILKTEVDKKLDDIDINLSKHPMYTKKITTIIDLKNNSKKKLEKMFAEYKETPNEELKQEIRHEINSLSNSIESMLDKAYELKKAKDAANRYLNRLIKHNYFDASREKEFKDRIKNAKTVSAVYKYHNILYTNYYYPKKVRDIKARLDNKVNYWIKTNKNRKEDFKILKDNIYEMLDNGSKTLKEKDLINTDSIGIKNAFELIDSIKNNKR